MSLSTKIQYTYEAICNINLALQEKGIDLSSKPELAMYGDLIRGLKIGSSGMTDEPTMMFMSISKDLSVIPNVLELSEELECIFINHDRYLLPVSVISM